MANPNQTMKKINNSVFSNRMFRNGKAKMAEVVSNLAEKLKASVEADRLANLVSDEDALTKRLERMEQELRQVKWELAHVRNEIRNLTKEVEVEVFVGDMVTA